MDNTETLTQSVDDQRNLVNGINRLARKIGRVLVTSRRLEGIEARQIHIEPWSDDESARYLKKRGEGLVIDPLNSAGEATLKRYGRNLQNKPIVLEAFVQVLKRSRSSLDAAFSEIQGLQHKDLGAFLYEDAWERMSEPIRHLFLLMTRTADLHDKISLELCCRTVGITVFEAEDALRESRGIAALADYQGFLEIVFTPGFISFCAARNVIVGGEQLPRTEDVQQVLSAYQQAINLQKTGSDWQMRALRSRHARSAQRAFDEKRREDALSHFHLAIEEDGENGALRCQYAKALTTYRRHDEAIEQANLAVRLAPDDPECHIIKARVEIERGRTADALQTIDAAQRLGKDSLECNFLRARAYVEWQDTTTYVLDEPARIAVDEAGNEKRDEYGSLVTIDEKGHEELISIPFDQRLSEARRYLKAVGSDIPPGSNMASQVRRLETKMKAMKHEDGGNKM